MKGKPLPTLHQITNEPFENKFWNEVIRDHNAGFTSDQIKEKYDLTERMTMMIIGQYHRFIREYNSTLTYDNSKLTKNEPYYEHEMEYAIKCEIPFNKTELAIEVDSKYLDVNYHVHIAKSL